MTPSQKSLPLDAEVQIHSLRAQMADLKSRLVLAHEKLAEAHKKVDVAFLLREKAETVALRIKPKRLRKTDSQSTALLVASDWHVEETVDPETVNGSNAFNLDSAKSRAICFFENAVKLIRIQRGGTHIDSAILALLGDFITGYIHDDLVETNSLSPTEAVVFAQELLIAGIQYLLDEGELRSIVIPCCTGNHSRTTKKPRVSTLAVNSFEFLLYRSLASHFKSEKRVTFQIARGYHAFVDVYGKRLRFHHGDHIKYHGGVGGITIPVNKAIAQWDKQSRADLDVFGHYHQYKQDRKWLSNGSLIGYNSYAQSIKADFEPPSQTFALIEKDNWLTLTAPVFLT